MISFMNFHVILSVDLFAKEERYGDMRSPVYSTRELLSMAHRCQMREECRTRLTWKSFHAKTCCNTSVSPRRVLTSNNVIRATPGQVHHPCSWCGQQTLQGRCLVHFLLGGPGLEYFIGSVQVTMKCS